MLLLKKCVQAIELLFPETAVFVQPLRGGLEYASSQPAIRDAALLHAFDQAGVLEHSQMLGDGGRRDVERLSEIADRALARREPFDHCAPRWIGKCSEYQIERLVLTHRLDIVSYADSVGAGYHVAFDAHGRGHHFVVLSTGYAQVLQRRYDVQLKDMPVVLRDFKAVVRCLHIAAQILHWAAEGRTQEIDNELSILPQAVLALAFPVHADTRVAQEARQQIVDEGGNRIVAAQAFIQRCVGVHHDETSL
jgi:hypothetical protein